MPIGGELLFGQIAIQNGMIRDTDLAHALEVQQREARSGRTVSIGRVMVDLGLLDDAKIETILAIQKFVLLREEDKSFGRLAVANKFISEPQLQRCLDQQKLAWKGKRSMVRIGEIMIQLGLLSVQQRDAILVSQKRLLHASSTVVRPEGGAAPRHSDLPKKIEVIIHEKPAPTAPVAGTRPGTGEGAGAAEEPPVPETRLGMGSIDAPVSSTAEDKDASDPLICLRTCVYCQATTDGEKVRCQMCGRRSCVYCGMLAEDDDVKCRDCGARLGE